MGELIERVDEQDRVLEVVERAEAVRRRWLHRIATTMFELRKVVDRGPFVPGGREALRRYLGRSAQ
ncbi:hypothetical protein [Nonomuraea sp. NPDC050540]|uniref:hypothetical protein n=1 Tax=Nonomuraea sp. NPDC050540 TaxID=3364367 RepID=UPI0037A4F8FC